jgi:hypothetical protein
MLLAIHCRGNAANFAVLRTNGRSRRMTLNIKGNITHSFKEHLFIAIITLSRKQLIKIHRIYIWHKASLSKNGYSEVVTTISQCF